MHIMSSFVLAYNYHTLMFSVENSLIMSEYLIREKKHCYWLIQDKRFQTVKFFQTLSQIRKEQEEDRPKQMVRRYFVVLCCLNVDCPHPI